MDLGISLVIKEALVSLGKFEESLPHDQWQFRVDGSTSEYPVLICENSVFQTACYKMGITSAI